MFNPIAKMLHMKDDRLIESKLNMGRRQVYLFLLRFQKFGMSWANHSNFEYNHYLTHRSS